MWNSTLASNMNFPAPIAVMGFLAGAAGTVIVLLAIAVATLTGKRRLASLGFRLLSLAALVYGSLLVGFALGSRERLLNKGEEKYFCEIDCHLAYSVVEVKAAPDANAVHYAITLRTRFDEKTISPRRPKDAPLTPNRREVWLVDADGHHFAPDASMGPVLTTPLTPGQSYLTDLNFITPKAATDLRLLVVSAPEWQQRLLIGDENSWGHKQTYFRL